MSLTPVQRELLLDGPHGWGKKQDVVKAFGGPCQIITAWRKHRAELMAACPMGKRLLELDLCRDSAERAILQYIGDAVAIGIQLAERLLIHLARPGRHLIQAAVGFTVDNELCRLE